MEKIDEYKERYAKLFPELNERQRRLVAAADAMGLGYGGREVIHKASKLARNTIHKGRRELEEGEHLPEGRCRKAGGGRKQASEKDKQLQEDLLLCIKPATKGDPMSPLLWVSKSSRKIQELLNTQGHRISQTSVRTLFQRNGSTLQSNRKARDETTMKEEQRDQQFHSISRLAGSSLKGGSPVISSDAKKKERVGNSKNGGSTWQVSKKPIEVKMHDFLDKKLGKAIPYGVSDPAMNEGYVTVGITHDTAEFAVASIENWWEHLGKEKYAAATKLLITVDAGGSNGYRVRLWKLKLQEFADRSHLAITVCHFPAGTSKWNAIEHKLFSFISMNWKGQPLLSFQVIISLISATTTQTGLKVSASLDTGEYETKKEVTEGQMKSLKLFPHKFHPELNYTLLPRF